MSTTSARINGIQHIGIAVNDMDASLKYFRTFFGLDIPFFDAVAPADLMIKHTNGNVITKRASMIMNLQGGCAVEVIRPTTFEPVGPKFDLALGDLGIYISLVKCKNPEAMRQYCIDKGAKAVSELKQRPNGEQTFMIQDLDGNHYQYVQGEQWFSDNGHPSGGMAGCSIGVSDIEKAKSLYSDILGYDEVIYDETSVFEDWSHLPGGDSSCRRVLLSQSQQPGGGFARVTGKSYIELIERKDYQATYIFKDRIWADNGFVHLGLDVRGMKALGEQLANKGFGFTCDSNDALDMGNTKVHCTYIDDPDKAWIELIEVYKVPIIEKWGVFLNVEKRDPNKPLPNFMLKALRFSRIKD
ncbi:MAG: VOC family protein [Flavobacteriales bacterium]|nr:VOC family protein [Flavobacteriales bacterium]MDG1766927.1 VOC family protein [Flavobacteriales bacterium]